MKAVRTLIGVIGLLAAVSCAGQPSKWKTGTLTHMEGTGTEQAYFITGDGMEYVVVENNQPPAHVVINDAVAYLLEGDRFYFADREGHQHPARIARQTLIDPNLRAATVPVVIPAPAILPTRWKEVNGNSRFTVRQAGDSIYAEQIIGPRQKGTPVKFEATWRGDQYVGRMYWTEGKCSLTSEVDLQPKQARMEGYFSFPTASAKLNKKLCRYSEMRPFPLLWVAD